jgi:hypothetical protein
MHERIGPVEGVEGRDKAIEDIALRRSGPRPRGKPMRCPSLRVRSNKSTVPSGPSSATVCSSAWSRLTRYEATSSRRNNEAGRVRLPSKISSGSLRRNIK